MSKRDKLIQKIFSGNADVTPKEAVKILENLGFKTAPSGSSHLTFRKPNRPSVTIVLTQDAVKSYLLEKLREALINEGYKNE